jgi:hypothetical protein
MMAGSAFAADARVLKADLDGDGDIEGIMQMSNPSPSTRVPLFTTRDLDKDGDPDVVETRGVPKLLGQMDEDSPLEVIVQDSALGRGYVASGLSASADSPIALVFVRGEVAGFAPTPNSNEQTLVVYDPPLHGTSVDLDDDGHAEIKFYVYPA